MSHSSVSIVAQQNSFRLQFSSKILDEFRQIGDEPADKVIAEMANLGGTDAVKGLSLFLTDFYDWELSKQPQVVQTFINSLATDCDKKTLTKAIRFYQNKQQEIGLVLGCYSLPYCYLAEDGARVLYLSERIRNNTLKRLIETGEFVNGIFNEKEWQNGRAIFRIAKVRLLHATARWFCQQSGRWQNAWGLPVNQEDMVGTNLAFSFIVLRGLQKMGHKVSDSEANAYFRFWVHIGLLMGILPRLIPQNFQEAYQLDTQIAQRHFRPSDIGQELCEALRATIESLQINPLLKNFPTAQMRYLLGDEYANYLGLPLAQLPQNIISLRSELRTIFI